MVVVRKYSVHGTEQVRWPGSPGSSPDFAVGMIAAATIFRSNAGTPAFLPIISEMKNPREYNKALYICNLIACSAYLAFGLVVYRWCGSWVTSPSLGSAGPLLKKVSYSVGLLGITVHISAKYIFVRALRGTRHPQSNTIIHWTTWIGCTATLSLIAFIIALAIPVFNQIIGIAGALGLAPLGIILPAWFWLYDHGDWRTASVYKAVIYHAHLLMGLIELFMCVSDTCAGIASVISDYNSGRVSGVFSCADNSNTVG